LQAFQMLVLDRQSIAASRPTSKLPVQLRFRAEGQLVELPVGKTTIGSSPRCNLRIQKPGVQPVHCLIVHGPEGLTVRRWAANTQLNGVAFDEAPLVEGDCLTIGGVELELVPTRPITSRPEELTPKPNALSDALLDTMQESVDAMADMDAISVAAEPPAIWQVARAPEFEPIAPAVVEVVAEVPATTVDPALDDAAELHASEAAEFVFQELQLACANSRGRTRKLLAALRAKQENYNELAERLSDVESQLAELRKLRNEWDETQCGHEAERREWEAQLQELRLQLSEWEVRLAEQAQHLAELREELAVARLNESAVDESTDVASAAYESPSASQVYDWLPVNMAPHATSEEVASNPTPPASVDVTCSRQSPEVVEPNVPPVSRTASVWGVPAASEVWPASGNESVEPVREEPVCEEAKSDNSICAEPVVAEQSVWNAEPNKSTTEPSEEFGAEAAEENPFAQLSIWKQAALLDTPRHDEKAANAPVSTAASAQAWGGKMFGDASDAPAEVAPSTPQEVESPVAEQASPWAQATEDAPAEAHEVVAPKPEPTSFIERYSHMFAEDGAGGAAPIAPVPQTPVPVVINSPPRAMGIIRNESVDAKLAPSDEEESIEQYMAKLLQRVRRDAPAGAASQAPPAPHATAEETAAAEAAEEEAASQQQVAAVNVEAPQPESNEPMSEADAEREIATWHTGDRKPVASTSDMGALRALANQTARRAIGRHQLAKHKRDATTKVIVSTLAGVTSLWLMILAPNWRDIQFIAACGSLLVAAYWAGEAFREMLRSWQAAAYRGHDDLLHDSSEHQHAGLPIDVEDRF
jgi:hypothetical protein